MAPLIDVVFQLLIFFMLSSSFLTPTLTLTLPKAVRQDRPMPERVVISVDKRGAIFLDTARVSLQELVGQLSVRLASDTAKAVHLRGDAEMSYQLFVQIMDAARQAGARQIHILHQSARP